jgi:predicted enzyme related to lactoylglutathione lyase
MPSSNLPEKIDRNKLAEAALAILSLTLHDDGRVWKGLDWNLVDLLCEKGWVVDPRSNAKSVVLTEDGERLGQEFLQKHFGSRGASGDSREDESRAGAVLYAKNVERVVAFYSAVLGFQISAAEESHVVLESSSFQLVVLRIPDEIASSITITAPPTRRASAAIKPVFFVANIAAVRATADALGGKLNSRDKEWSFQGFKVCDGLDPEGNVIQFREPADE